MAQPIHRWKNKNKPASNSNKTEVRAFKNRAGIGTLSVLHAQNHLLPPLTNLFQINKRSFILGQCYDNGSMPM